MTIDFENESSVTLDLALEEIAEAVVNAALDYIGCPYEAEVNLLITDNEEIHKMNLEFRRTDRATDVLSFPMVDYETPGSFDFLEQEGTGDYFNPETGELLLGDIVISAEKVLSQAAQYGHSPKREYAFLIAHSMLHLMGYDHMEPSEAEEMEEKQREILDKLNITR
ncbi:MAG: rRNA maturation RNase YbeY [Lachnospiraceae bacterium]|nr:rRNA maturation RNase YbeY [Lachnospiraceae bacterium]MDD3796585.1 rRNA maturation RNase YbeY [Lachnospiraceae bacterium]